MEQFIKHVAFIMDGNGRWAKARGLPRSLGHKEGCERIIEIYEECMAQKIEVMSLYAFSTENWKRPKTEIRQLFIYLNQFFKRELKRIIADGSRVIISGDITKLPEKTQKVVIDAMDKTKDGKNFTLNICLNYGGKAELVRAAKEIAKEVLNGEIRVDDIDESLVDNSLYTKGLPPVDLLIRTSGEMRTSNFMPWQLAYAEMMFPITPWPSFTKTEFHKCLDEFKNRSRRFGGLKNE